MVCVCGVQIAFWCGFWWCFDCNVGLGEQSVHATSHLFYSHMYIRSET